MVGSRDKMLARIKTRSYCYDCRDSDPIQPHHIERFEWLQKKPWQWEHQERGRCATFFRKNHRRKNRKVEGRRVEKEIREEVELYYDLI